MAYRLQLERIFTKHYKKLTAIERGMVDDRLRILLNVGHHEKLLKRRSRG